MSKSEVTLLGLGRLLPAPKAATRALHSSSPQQAAPDIRHLGLLAAAAALAVGLAYTAISAYWAFGGTWLLDTVSSSLVTAHPSVTAVMAVWAAVVLKAVAALLPLHVCLTPPPSKRHDRLRLLAWAEAAVLTLYGFAFTLAGLMLQVGIIHQRRTADRRALVWHAYLWDPWFLVWGLSVIIALALTSTSRNCPATNLGSDGGRPVDAC
jgi:Protein of unknown function (DUF3995)